LGADVRVGAVDRDFEQMKTLFTLTIIIVLLGLRAAKAAREETI
jgi:hypothetical protein